MLVFYQSIQQLKLRRQERITKKKSVPLPRQLILTPFPTFTKSQNFKTLRVAFTIMMIIIRESLGGEFSLHKTNTNTKP